MAGKTVKEILEGLPGEGLEGTQGPQVTPAAAELTVEDILSLESAFADYNSRLRSASFPHGALDSCCCCCTAVSSVSQPASAGLR